MIVTSVQIKTAKTQKHLYCLVFTPFLEKPPKKAVFLRYKFNFRSALGHMLIVVRAVKWPLRLRYRVTLKTTKSLTHP